MIFAGFSIVKFFSGFNIFSGVKLGKLIFYGILIAVGLTIYHKAFEPKTVTRIETQVIERQIIYPESKEAGFAGIKLWKLRFGLSIQ